MKKKLGVLSVLGKYSLLRFKQVPVIEDIYKIRLLGNTPTLEQINVSSLKMKQMDPEEVQDYMIDLTQDYQEELPLKTRIQYIKPDFDINEPDAALFTLYHLASPIHDIPINYVKPARSELLLHMTNIALVTFDSFFIPLSHFLKHFRLLFAGISSYSVRRRLVFRLDASSAFLHQSFLHAPRIIRHSFSTLVSPSSCSRVSSCVSSLSFSSLVLYRSMFHSRQTMAHVTFNFMKALSNDNIFNAPTSGATEAVLSNFMIYALDYDQGIPQHKGAFIHKIIRNKYATGDIFKSYKELNPKTKIEVIPEALTDCRVYAEYASIRDYEQAFFDSIKQILLTSDSLPTYFYKQGQKNPDGLTHIITGRKTYFDAKSGMHLAKHSSNGSIGTLVYDHKGKLIPFTTIPLDLEDILRNHIKGLSLGLSHDNYSTNKFQLVLNEARTIINSDRCLFQRNREIQSLLWNNMQSDIEYKRSVSFVFDAHQRNMQESPAYYQYKDMFIVDLPDKMYDLNRKQDQILIIHAMLKTFYPHDPHIIKKFTYLQKVVGIEFDTTFLKILSDFIKIHL